MKNKGLDKLNGIISTANQLFYQRGYNQTSFSDIATAAGVPRGNFYYYFKSKDEILQAVIEDRMQSIRAMLQQWEQEFPVPKDRLKRFIKILLNSEDDVLRYGCPMGSLGVELSKTQLVLQSKAAEMFELFAQWLAQQFTALGHTEQARSLAMHLLAVTQGVVLLTNIYSDTTFLHQEVARLNEWVDNLQ